MSTSSPRFLTTAVILLLLINTGLVVYLVLDRNQSHRHNTGRNRLDTSALLAKEINLTAAQEQQHRELREAHFKNIGLLYDSIREVKSVLFTTTNTIATDSLLEISNQKINNWQSTINALTVSYLQKVRKLLTQEQQKGYDQFVIKMMQRGRRDSSRGR
jgi:Spy/CpxP family protein refolding chaperone